MNDAVLNRDVRVDTPPATGAALAPMLSYAGPDTAAPPPVQRLVSLDAYRGLVMVLMVSAGLSMGSVAKSFPNSANWHFLGYHTDHPQWRGTSLWDMIQPCFMFMVGAALPFSIASRRAKGQTFSRMLLHAIGRAAILILLCVFLTSNWSKQTNWSFTNVLGQIGLGYVFLFLLAWVRPTWQLVAAAAILIGYWALFALYPATPPGFDFATVNAKGWPYAMDGIAAHWDKNTNAGAAFDVWFLNLFPRESKFIGEPGGYVTLNFVPALVTMLFGLMAGQLLRTSVNAGLKILTLLTAAAVGLAAGYVLDYTNICPSIKRIWTPSWTLFSAGWAFLGLAFFYLVCDVARLRAWAMPLVVVGMNSIAVYCLSMTMKSWVREQATRHFGKDFYTNGGWLLGGGGYATEFAPMFQSGLFLVLLWLVAWWMFRRKIFIKV
jgi:predicted acyltransferase